ncbi:MAG: hypothetical protein B6244_09245 [Candidatus Cloacimonetes bacterium 4572_55]|nr:MAG: hypothetical protein B6244_09245 [Candidatus Cloacimonetes bacterium 4572_55]
MNRYIILFLIGLFTFSHMGCDEDNLPVPFAGTDPPVLTIISPLNNANVDGTVEIVVVAEDTDSFIEEIELFIDADPVASVSSDTLRYEWDTFSLLDGEHRITARAIDTQGNEFQSDTTRVFIRANISMHRIVLTEMFTGTWCAPCNEFADPAMDSLVHLYGSEQLLSVQYHYGGDPWDMSENHDRLTYYDGNTTFPLAFFDGGSETVSANETIFAEYHMHIESALAVDPQVGFELLSGSLAEEQISVRVKALANLSGMNLRLRGVITENNMAHNSHNYHHVVRLHFDPQEADLVNNGDVQIFTIGYQIDQEWDVANLELILFVQNDNDRSVLQSFILTE